MNSRVIGHLAAACCISILAGQSFGAIVFVDVSAAPGGDGRSWDRAFNTLEDALAAARADDQIWIAKGTYSPVSPSGRDATFSIPDDVEVYGGFEGREERLEERGDPREFETVLDGNLPSGDRVYHVVTFLNAGPATVLDGVTITGGNADAGGLRSLGGGILINNASPTLRQLCVIDNNASASGGGVGVFSALGSTLVHIEDSTFSDNSAGMFGGAISSNDHLDIDGCVFEMNSSGSLGGAIRLANAAPDEFTFIDDSEFVNNSASDAGAGISSGDNIDIDDCVFRENNAFTRGGAIELVDAGIVLISDTDFRFNAVAPAGATSGAGGAIFVEAGGGDQVRIEGCTFIGNEGGLSGGVYVATSGFVEIFRSGFYQNTALTGISTNGASALMYTNNGNSSGGTLVVDTCLFSGNVAQSISSTIYNRAFNHTLIINNSTIVNNTSAGTISAGFFDLGATSAITNSILWNNDLASVSGQNNNLFVNPSASFSLNRSIVGQLGVLAPPPPGANNSDEDPMFVDADGGNNIAGDLDDNVNLMPGSPAIDAGNSPAVSPDVLADFYAQPRFADDTGTPDSGVSDGFNPIVDIGAAEFQGTTVSACSQADLAEPFGSLNFFDLAAYIALFNAGDPAADLAEPIGTINFFDIAGYIALFNTGCP